MSTPVDSAAGDVLASLYDAGALLVPPWMALVTALASARPDGIAATSDGTHPGGEMARGAVAPSRSRTSTWPASSAV